MVQMGSSLAELSMQYKAAHDLYRTKVANAQLRHDFSYPIWGMGIFTTNLGIDVNHINFGCIEVGGTTALIGLAMTLQGKYQTRKYKDLSLETAIMQARTSETIDMPTPLWARQEIEEAPDYRRERIGRILGNQSMMKASKEGGTE
jgi:hypothetical protein